MGWQVIIHILIKIPHKHCTMVILHSPLTNVSTLFRSDTGKYRAYLLVKAGRMYNI